MLSGKLETPLCSSRQRGVSLLTAAEPLRDGLFRDSVDGLVAQLLGDAEQLVVFGHAVGAYLLAKPSGAVTGLVTAAAEGAAALAAQQTPAPESEAAETAAEVLDESVFPTE